MEAGPALIIATAMKFMVPILTIAFVLICLKALLVEAKKKSLQRRIGFPMVREWQPVEPLATLKVSSRRPLTKFEENMYFVIAAALPECIVLAQVSFSSLINTENKADRNRFDRKTADFVICSRKLTAIAILELDDPSHLGKTEKDADRDALMATAGYTTLRYKSIPGPDTIRRDVEHVLSLMTAHNNL